MAGLAQAKASACILFIKWQPARAIKQVFTIDRGKPLLFNKPYYNMSNKEEIKFELVNYKPSEDEKLVIKSAVFNFITLGERVDSI